MPDLIDEYSALTTSGGATGLSREVIRVSGSDAASYLHGQVTQDIESMNAGDSRWSFVLQPHGKVDAFVRITRTGEEEFLIDADAGQRDVIVERFERFKMRTKVQFEPLDWKVLALRGSDVRAPEAKAAVVIPVDWRGMKGFDLLGESPAVPKGFVEVSAQAYEALRIAAGMPVMGAELDQLTIPAEAGINDLTISFKKGCYTGQELVARIDARGGNVPRHLRAVVIDNDEYVPGDAVIMPTDAPANAKPLGALTSVAFSPKLGRFVGLALIRRDALPPVDAVIIWDDGPTSCRIETLPLEL